MTITGQNNTCWDVKYQCQVDMDDTNEYTVHPSNSLDFHPGSVWVGFQHIPVHPNLQSLNNNVLAQVLKQAIRFQNPEYDPNAHEILAGLKSMPGITEAIWRPFAIKIAAADADRVAVNDALDQAKVSVPAHVTLSTVDEGTFYAGGTDQQYTTLGGTLHWRLVGDTIVVDSVDKLTSYFNRK